jgi:hypothetical protein
VKEYFLEDGNEGEEMATFIFITSMYKEFVIKEYYPNGG